MILRFGTGQILPLPPRVRPSLTAPLQSKSGAICPRNSDFQSSKKRIVREWGPSPAAPLKGAFTLVYEVVLPSFKLVSSTVKMLFCPL